MVRDEARIDLEDNAQLFSDFLVDKVLEEMQPLCDVQGSIFISKITFEPLLHSGFSSFGTL